MVDTIQFFIDGDRAGVEAAMRHAEWGEAAPSHEAFRRHGCAQLRLRRGCGVCDCSVAATVAAAADAEVNTTADLFAPDFGEGGGVAML